MTKIAKALSVAVAGVAAVAGAYYFYGKDGVKHRRKFKHWAMKAQDEVMEKLEDMQDITRKKYDEVVDQVLSKYEAMKDTDPEEFRGLTEELKSHWEGISGTLNKFKKASGKEMRRIKEA